MIEIIDFNDFLPPDVKRGKVKHPRWFRQRCNLSSEAQVLLQSEDGPALFGVWCLIQAWAMRHPRRGGRFVFSNGTPMELQDLSTAIGIPGKDNLVYATINRVMNMGWVKPWSSDGVPMEDFHKNSTLDKRREEDISSDQSNSSSNSVSLLEENLVSSREQKSQEVESKPEPERSDPKGANPIEPFRKMVALVADWKGCTPGILEARLVHSVIETTTESPVGGNCPQTASLAVLRHAVESGIEYTSPVAAEHHCLGVLGQWRQAGEIPEKWKHENDK